ncbi:hypothetical protein DAI18_06835 [Microvirgula aerodenitrificans]|uniref:AbiTii domain-containing protein n=1 Tax=Microvirgula aerodenitrificans TaxID=57480 RepID=A0A2S0P8S0_9NEIS|nr:hypothetical protein [Microvirgula aerodenitrificans]AVY93789.1 hypothetical protein DAI18_06835 [Microvirgula aerodenitrificans]
MSEKSSRVAEARSVASALLDDLESSTSQIDAILMRAKRLARIMRDTDAQSWLDFETTGYPESFSFSELGSCRKYAAASGRLNVATSKYYWHSLPMLEADATSEELLMSTLNPAASINSKAKDFLEKNATEALMATQLKFQNAQKKNYAHAKSLFASIKSGIHSYATDVYLAIELGDIAQDIFESTRDEIDNFVRVHAPQAAEKLIAINDRMTENSTESRTAALTSCRRLLMTVADSLFPPRDVDWSDAGGRPRKVGVDQYKNRLIAYISENTKSEGNASILESDLAYLAARLDAIYEKTCKGVHVDVTKQEARLAVIHTYLFIGELALCKNSAQPPQ